MKQQLVSRACPVCDAIYQADVGRLKWGRQTTCSRACSYRLRAQERDNKVSLICAGCGNKFERPRSQVKGKHGGQFCSRVCHYTGRATGTTKRVVSKPYIITEAGRAAWKIGGQKTVVTRRARDNYVQSDATRAKLSKATARALAKGQMMVISKLEDKVAIQLDLLNVVYIRQHAFHDPASGHACIVDFWLPKSNVVFEVNGTYWHADPRVYITLNAMQQRHVTRYTRKLKSLQSLGIRVIELWEQDLKRDITQTVFKAYTEATTG